MAAGNWASHGKRQFDQAGNEGVDHVSEEAQ